MASPLRRLAKGRPFVFLALSVLVTVFVVIPLQRGFVEPDGGKQRWLLFVWLSDLLRDAAFLVFAIHPFRLLYARLSAADWAQLNKEFKRANAAIHVLFATVCFGARFLLLYYQPETRERTGITFRWAVLLYIVVWTVSLLLALPLNMARGVQKERRKAADVAAQRAKVRAEFLRRRQAENPHAEQAPGAETPDAAAAAAATAATATAAPPAVRTNMLVATVPVAAAGSAALCLFAAAQTYGGTKAKLFTVLGALALAACVILAAGPATVAFWERDKDVQGHTSYVYACVVAGAAAYRVVTVFGSYFLDAMREAESAAEIGAVASVSVAFSLTVHLLLEIYERGFLARTYPAGTSCVMLFVVQFLESTYMSVAVLLSSIDDFSFWVLLAIALFKNVVRDTDLLVVCWRRAWARLAPVPAQAEHDAATAPSDEWLWKQRVKAQQSIFAGISSTCVVTIVMAWHHVLAAYGWGRCNLSLEPDAQRQDHQRFCIDPAAVPTTLFCLFFFLLVQVCGALFVRIFWHKRDGGAVKRPLYTEIMLLVSAPSDADMADDEETAVSTIDPVGRDIWHYWSLNGAFFSWVMCFAVVTLFSEASNPADIIGTAGTVAW